MWVVKDEGGRKKRAAECYIGLFGECGGGARAGERREGRGGEKEMNGKDKEDGW